MSPIVAELVEANGGHADAQVLWWALAFGADLGGNATAVGAAANVVVIGIAARNRTPNRNREDLCSLDGSQSLTNAASAYLEAWRGQT